MRSHPTKRGGTAAWDTMASRKSGQPEEQAEERIEMTTSQWEGRAMETGFCEIIEAEPKLATNYARAGEYARNRLTWSRMQLQQTESKARESIKLVLGSAAAGWAVFTFVRLRAGELPQPAVVCLVVSLALLAAAAVYALRACLPGKRPHLVADNAAPDSANGWRQAFEVMAKFRRMLSAAEAETAIAARKAGFILISTGSLTLAVVAFLLAVSLGVHR
jgi:hypothetical protein